MGIDHGGAYILMSQWLLEVDPSITEALNAMNDVKQPTDLVMKLRVSTSLTITT